MGNLNIFWDWSLKAYANPATQRACLQLQDKFGQDVNVLLWACWLASKKQSPTPNSLKEHIEITKAWQLGGLSGIRKARREIKNTSHLDTASALKNQFLKLELTFEKQEQLALETLSSQSAPLTLRESPQIRLHNLKMVTGLENTILNKALETLNLTFY